MPGWFAVGWHQCPARCGCGCPRPGSHRALLTAGYLPRACTLPGVYPGHFHGRTNPPGSPSFRSPCGHQLLESSSRDRHEAQGDRPARDPRSPHGAPPRPPFGAQSSWKGHEAKARGPAAEQGPFEGHSVRQQLEEPLKPQSPPTYTSHPNAGSDTSLSPLRLLKQGWSVTLKRGDARARPGGVSFLLRRLRSSPRRRRGKRPPSRDPAPSRSTPGFRRLSQPLHADVNPCGPAVQSPHQPRGQNLPPWAAGRWAGVCPASRGMRAASSPEHRMSVPTVRLPQAPHAKPPSPAKAPAPLQLHPHSVSSAAGSKHVGSKETFRKHGFPKPKMGPPPSRPVPRAAPADLGAVCFSVTKVQRRGRRFSKGNQKQTKAPALPREPVPSPASEGAQMPKPCAPPGLTAAAGGAQTSAVAPAPARLHR